MEPAGDIDVMGRTVLLLIEDDRNRELLAEQLGQTFEIRTRADVSFENPQFDLCLLDTESLGPNREQLRTAKRNAEPRFLPYLLLTGDQSPEDLHSDVWEIVDEVIQRPVSKAELDIRLTNLLHRGQLSLRLKLLKEQSEERFRSVFQAAPDPIVVVSSDGLVSNANEAFYRTFEFDEDELSQVPFTELGFRSRETDESTDAEQGSHRVYREQPDGDTLVMNIHINSVTLDDDVTEWIGIFRDITNIAQRMEELQRKYNQLKGLHWSRK